MKIKTGRIFWGVFFVLAAAFVVVCRMGMFVDVGIWSLIFTVFLVAIFVESLFHLKFPGIFFSAAFLAIIYAKPLGITSLVPWTVLGVALLLSIGFSLIFHKKYHYEKYCHKHDFDEHDFSEVIDEKDDSQINFKTSFAGTIKYVNCDDFKRANLATSFGSLKVYFDNAIIQDDSAVIAVDVSFGDMEIYLPRDWELINKTDASFGEVKVKNRPSGVNAKKIIVAGHVSMGDLKIYYN